MYASFNLVLCHPTIIKHEKICIDSQDDDFILFLILGKTSKTNYPPPAPRTTSLPQVCDLCQFRSGIH